MNPHVASLRDLGREALETARYNLAGGFFRATVNRTYYAAFYLARAALLKVDETPRTHRGVIRQFRLRYVQTGLLSPDVADALPQAFQMRQEADYDDGALVTEENAVRILADVTDFTQAVESLLGHEPPDPI